jgi:phosphoribosylanthranilate isomerase
MTRIKICGITNVDDALAAVEYGADAIGLVFASSPRRVDADTARRITEALPPFVARIGVFADEARSIVQVAGMCGLDAIQLHGNQSDEFAKGLMPYRRVIRVIRVKDGFSMTTVTDYPSADGYLLDSFVDHALGGTGKAFDWTLASLVKDFAKPIILAGGLNPDNVAEAIQTVRPYAIDVSSGVESEPGKKDHYKLKELIHNVRSVDASAG